jgi:hypothetical protein
VTTSSFIAPRPKDIDIFEATDIAEALMSEEARSPPTIPIVIFFIVL